MASKKYLEKLESINGIGPKLSRKIAQECSTEEQLTMFLAGGRKFSDPMIDQHLEELSELFLSTEEPEAIEEESEAVEEESEAVEEESEAVEEESEAVEAEADVEVVSDPLDFRDPNFDWQNPELWRENKDAVNYWLLTKT